MTTNSIDLYSSGSSLVSLKRVVPIEVLSNTSGNIVGITATVQQLQSSGIFDGKQNHLMVADIAICHKWWLRSFSQHALGQAETQHITVLFGTWHPFKQALKILWTKGIDLYSFVLICLDFLNLTTNNLQLLSSQDTFSSIFSQTASGTLTQLTTLSSIFFTMFGSPGLTVKTWFTFWKETIQVVFC